MKELCQFFYVSLYKNEKIQISSSLQYISNCWIIRKLFKKENHIFSKTVNKILDFNPYIYTMWNSFIVVKSQLNQINIHLKSIL